MVDLTEVIDLEALSANTPSGPKIKIEPGYEPFNFSSGFTKGEVINLLSDDEDDPAPIAKPSSRHLDSRFRANTPDQATTAGADLGQSLLSTVKPKKGLKRDDVLARQNALLEKARAGREAREKGVAEGDQEDVDQPENMASGSASGLFVPDRSLDSKTAMQIFAKLQREIVKKRRMGILTDEEEVEYLKAEAMEKDRLGKEEADRMADRTQSPTPGDDNDDFGAPIFGALVEEEPQKKGRKRRAPGGEAGQPKRSRKRARADDAADQTPDEAAAAATGAKKKESPKGKGKKARVSKAKPKGPEMTNTNNMMRTDVFHDFEQTRDLPDQPTFGETTHRHVALKQMVADLPPEKKKSANVDKRYMAEAMKAFTGTNSVQPATDSTWSVKGMRTTFKNYQVLGVAFMRRRENSSIAPQGGILGDSMGLGKTLMMLANIMNGMPVREKARKTTLIVAAPALVAQWAQEIRDHVVPWTENKKHGLRKVQRYHAGIKLGVDDEKAALEDADIVLTTYSQVCKSYPNCPVPPEYVTSQQKTDWWNRHYDTKKGILHQMKFHRVVLDEAQAIKNHLSITSMACRALKAKHLWAISGTPIMNSIKEFYPYFKFLREPSTHSYKLYKENFCSADDPDGSEKLCLFLRKLMIRRTHSDSLFGAKLVTLPQPEQTTIWLEFNEIERAVYDIVEARFIRKINQMSSSGELNSQYSHIFVMLTRLRQICGHVALAQGTIIDLLEREDYEQLNAIATREFDASEDYGALLMHLREQLAAAKALKTPKMHVDSNLGNTLISNLESAPTHLLSVDGVVPTLGGEHGLTYDFKKYLESLHKSAAYKNIIERGLCNLCNQPPLNPHVTSCFHVFCYECLQELSHRAAAKGQDCSTCKCGTQYTQVQPCQAALEGVSAAHASLSGSQEEVEFGANGVKKPPKKPTKVEHWMNMPGAVLPSAKTIAVKAQVMEWIQADPDVKIIIYTQFLDMVHILGRICATEEWDYCKYTGEMSHDAREKTIKEFGSKTLGKRVMLASLRCGGLGLNLTMASRVITLDPWWNASVEQQAFCRVFRIGQVKETQMTRLVVKGTIDDRMMRMQKTKQEAIDEVMDDKNGRQLNTLEAMQLFGTVGERGGKPFIFAKGATDDDGNPVGEPDGGRYVDDDSEDEENHLGEEA